MDNYMKYVVIMGGYFGDIEVPIIFSNLQDHSKITKNAVSAGFCNICAGDHLGDCVVECCGRSDSLKVSSRGYIDELLIDKMLNAPRR